MLARRQRWHRRVAEALERDPRAGELSHLLAKHFDAGGEPARAIPAYAAAARQAGLRYATSDAVALCARALDLLPRLPQSRERDLLELDILGTMCRQVSSNAFSAAFAGREPLAVYVRAIDIARSVGDAPSLYSAITRLCNYNMIVARYAQSAELGAELERMEQQYDLDPALLHGGIFARAYIAFFSADCATALRLFEQLVPNAHDTSVFHANLPGRALALGHLACVRWVVGEPDRTLDEAWATIDNRARRHHQAADPAGARTRRPGAAPVPAPRSAADWSRKKPNRPCARHSWILASSPRPAPSPCGRRLSAARSRSPPSNRCSTACSSG